MILTITYNQDENAVALRYDTDLARVIAASSDGSPDYDGVKKMQDDYNVDSCLVVANGICAFIKCFATQRGKRWRGKKVVFYHPEDWNGLEINLVDAVKKAVKHSAIPEYLCGYV